MGKLSGEKTFMNVLDFAQKPVTTFHFVWPGVMYSCLNNTLIELTAYNLFSERVSHTCMGSNPAKGNVSSLQA